jgi:hypothetical protein
LVQDHISNGLVREHVSAYGGLARLEIRERQNQKMNRLRRVNAMKGENV